MPPLNARQPLRSKLHLRLIAPLLAVALAVGLASLPVAAWAIDTVAPTVNDGGVTAQAGAHFEVMLSADDDDYGSTMTFGVVEEPSNGELTSGATDCADGVNFCTWVVYYDPDPGTRNDSFTYTATDEYGNESDEATFTIEFEEPDAPSADTGAADVAKDSPTAIALDGFGPDGSTLAFEVTQPAGNIGSLSSPGAATCTLDSDIDWSYCSSSVTYTPPAQGLASPVTFTYRVTNAAGTQASPWQTVKLRVNARPKAVNDRITAVPGRATTVNVLANDTDPDGDDLEITGRSQAAHGQVACTVRHCSYISNPGYKGPDSFTYTISDWRLGGTATGTVSVDVRPAAVKPPTVVRPGATRIAKASPGPRRGPRTGIARWGAPASTGGAPISSYVVTAYRFKGGKVVSSKRVTVPGNRRSVNMALGKAKGKWAFRVSAVNRVGYGASSALSNRIKAK